MSAKVPSAPAQPAPTTESPWEMQFPDKDVVPPGTFHG